MEATLKEVDPAEVAKVSSKALCRNERQRKVALTRDSCWHAAYVDRQLQSRSGVFLTVGACWAFSQIQRLLPSLKVHTSYPNSNPHLPFALALALSCSFVLPSSTRRGMCGS